ncbi:tetratricopeptide repeat protein [Ideonella sp.]|uniref:tetratricopeptide repeat protein n=1 Tax=Ideonella sp. TaxID=1929293 RepID=UPI002B49AA9B|nr:tetratricopeptide repeat protein [Ideonella sp.]HJV70623.1 tetratricopeptide repeat protein [Ideonella sp.]
MTKTTDTRPALRRAWLTALLALAPALAWAAGGGGGGAGGGNSGPPGASDPDYAAAVKAIKAGDFAGAIPRLKAYVGRVPNDAYGENWLAYAYRKSGQLDAAFEHYDKALAIDPNHLGAHEYAGEAYLMVGNLAKAEEHLKALDKLCFLPCEEYTDLKKEVAAYKARNGATAAR